MSLFLIASLGSLHSPVCCVCLERDTSIPERRYFTVISTVFHLTRFRQNCHPVGECFSFLLPLFVYFLINFIFFVYDNLMEELLCYYLLLVYIFAK